MKGKQTCTAAQKLNAAVKEYKGCLTKVGMRPLIVFKWGLDFFVTHYHSKWYCEKQGFFVCNSNEVNPTLRVVNR